MRHTVRGPLGHDPHDYILDGVCKALDGVDVLATIRTGGGKTDYFLGYILAMKHLSETPTDKFVLPRPVPKKPVMIAVYPTNVLEEEMVR